MKRFYLTYYLKIFLLSGLFCLGGKHFVYAQSVNEHVKTQAEIAKSLSKAKADNLRKADSTAIANAREKAEKVTKKILSDTAKVKKILSDTAKVKKAMADTTAIKKIRSVGDSLATVLTDSTIAKKLSADSLHNEATLDSTAIVQKTDSLLGMNAYKKTRFIPDPQRALWLSLIIPGAGQIYNRKLWKIPIVYGGFLGCLYALTWNNQMYSDYSQAYLDIMDDDPNTKSYMNMLPINYDITGREEQYKEIFKNKKNYYRKYRDMSIFAMIGVYLLSVVDAYVDAELSSFDISRDLGLKLEPAIFNTNKNLTNASVGIQFNLTLK